MACANLSVCGGCPARLFRISFSGEFAYEIAVPSRYGDAMIRALMQVGEPLASPLRHRGAWRHADRGRPCHRQRAERHHRAQPWHGADGVFVQDSIGAILAGREALVAEDGLRLVGLRALDDGQVIADRICSTPTARSMPRMTVAMRHRRLHRRVDRLGLWCAGANGTARSSAR